MVLPITFLAGLLVLFANRELAPPVPGSGQADVMAAFAPLLALPAALAALALFLVRRELLTGRSGFVPPRAPLRLSAFATLLSLHVVMDQGGWSDLASRISGRSQLLDIGLLLLPLFVAEAPRLLLATAAEFHLEVAGGSISTRLLASTMLPSLSESWPILRTRLGWPLLLVMPCALFGLGVDLVQQDRSLHVFLLTTTPGGTAATLAFLLLASALLPGWFRIAFGVVRDLPEPVGARLRSTAAALGFPPSRVLLLPTAMRAMNAMMVGPLPVGRFLGVTDGLVQTLDEDSLAGVVAHEVGHAKKGHPLLLMTFAVVVPLLAMAPLRVLRVEELDAASKGAGIVAAGLLTWSIVRFLAHRFELEADAASVAALGAGPCSRALMLLSRAAMPVSHGLLRRHFTLHPDERRRWEFMRRYEGEPAFRAAFEADGRRLRRVGALVVASVAAGALWAWSVEWPHERAIWRFYAGDFVEAQRAVAALGEEVPPHWRQTWPRFCEELAAGLELAPQAADWDAARARLAGAWQRGVEVLLRDGPAAARPWFSLALDADPDAAAWQQAVHDYCRAASHEDLDRMEEAREVVRRLGVPAELRDVFGA